MISYLIKKLLEYLSIEYDFDWEELVEHIMIDMMLIFVFLLLMFVIALVMKVGGR